MASLLVLLPPLCRRLPGTGIELPGTGMPLAPPSGSNLEYSPRRLGVRNSPSPSSSSSMRLMLAECPCTEPLSDDLGRPSGVRAPESEDRDRGRGGAISVREGGRAEDEILARELGRLISDSGPRFGSGPYERRPTLDSLSRGTWLLVFVEARWLVGVVSSPATDEAADPMVRFRERMVTVAGTLAPLTEDRGDARGGV